MNSARRVIFAAIAAAAFASPALADDTIAKHHMIAAANPAASEAGREMMRKGGSAVDAGIAAQLVLTLVEPESSGIGGGAFMIVYDPRTKRTLSFDGRETAPAADGPGMFLGPDGKPRQHMDAIPGGLSTGVPGVIAMFEMVHKRFGRLPWATLFDPAIRLAANGFPVSRKLARELKDFAPQMTRMPDMNRYFYHGNGTPLAEGEIVKNPELAATLRAIAKGGAKAFYSGKIARNIVDAVTHAPVNPGPMTLKDLASYRAVERPTVCGTYRSYKLCSMGPPSSGGVAVLQILGMLERFPSSDLQPSTLSEVHLFTQASRLAFADRAKYLGDPDVINVPVRGLIDPGYLAQRSALIDAKKDMGTATAGNPPDKRADYAPQRSQQLPGTSHLSAVDDHGMVVSMTMTIEFAFGSETMANGFLLNNELTDFSFDPVLDGKPVANAPGPGKRPMSAMSPTIVFDPHGRFAIAAGSPGGPAIIDYVANALIGMIDGKLGPQEAAALPHPLNLNTPTILEKGTVLEQLAPQLTAMGHTVVPRDLESGLHIIQKVAGGYRGGADPRRDGVALGD
ncbi:MAG: gamma-glutamyltransferase [Alphaproteobacteria bacterium]|nr:gamma-glutamyltransferase [Alphaproteobacteria bacterium]MBL7098908.1 gamma-glutamyltransferase [Alphaproteobacteria bacterium]